MRDDQTTTADSTTHEGAAEQGTTPAKPAKPARKRTPRKAAAAAAPADQRAADAADATDASDAGTETARGADLPAADAAPAKPARKRTPRKKVADVPALAQPAETVAPVVADRDLDPTVASTVPETEADVESQPVKPAKRVRKAPPALTFQPPALFFQPPADRGEADTDVETEADEGRPAPRSRTRKPRIVVSDEPAVAAPAPMPRAGKPSADATAAQPDGQPADDETDEDGATRRRRRGRRGRGRRGEAGTEPTEAPGQPTADAEAAGATGPADADDDDSEEARGTRRRRRRRRGGGGDDAATDDPPRTVTKVREPRSSGGGNGPRSAGGGNEVRGLSGSTRLEAKKIRRREGREQSRRRPPVITESEFLARRESVERVMLVQQYDDRTQIAVLEDEVLVEHYVTKAQSTSYAGNVYLGRVQNVLPSMEAAFVDIGKGRNAVLYAGEVNYDTSALEGRAPRIEQALKSGQEIVVQVTKDPIGQKGSRLTSQVSLPGRYMVYVPEGSMTGISRKLPDTERTRLKGILKTLKPEGAGIIVRTAAEGASEDDLTADLDRLKAQWESIEKATKKGKAPALLHGEPDLVIRVIRDNFNEDFHSLVVSGAGDYDTIHEYLEYLAPDLMPRLDKWVEPTPLFDHHRVNEQLLKAMDRKVWLPSGGSLVIDRTEAMTVVDVNTGKFTGKGGNLEETVTRNNLEAAEEIVRQLRLRDIGGIIVVDFIDMVLESNRDLVMRRLRECLGRDRTKHQVAEVTSLGLVQMTRKRISQGLIEAFSETCPECNGRGIKVHIDMLGGTAGGSRRSDAAKPRPIVIPKPVPRPPAQPPEAGSGIGDGEDLGAGDDLGAGEDLGDGIGIANGNTAGTAGAEPAAGVPAATLGEVDPRAAQEPADDGLRPDAESEGTPGPSRRSRGGRSRRGRGEGDGASAVSPVPAETAATPRAAAARTAVRTPVPPRPARVIDDTEDDWAWAAGPVEETVANGGATVSSGGDPGAGSGGDPGAGANGDAGASANGAGARPTADAAPPSPDDDTSEGAPVAKKPARRRGGRGRGKAAAAVAPTET